MSSTTKFIHVTPTGKRVQILLSEWVEILARSAEGRIVRRLAPNAPEEIIVRWGAMQSQRPERSLSAAPDSTQRPTSHARQRTTAQPSRAQAQANGGGGTAA